MTQFVIENYKNEAWVKSHKWDKDFTEVKIFENYDLALKEIKDCKLEKASIMQKFPPYKIRKI